MALTTGWFIVSQQQGVSKDPLTGVLTVYVETTYSNGTQFAYGRTSVPWAEPGINTTELADLDAEAAANAGVWTP